MKHEDELDRLSPKYADYVGAAQAMTMPSQGPSCPYCSGNSTMIWHSGVCPKVKAIEYHPNGSIKRVEFHGSANFGIGGGPP